jgi:LytS/YehU family sensor histidine kinase
VALRRDRQLQAETQLRAAQLELELLRQQIQPHFLMNTLAALCEWVESDPTVGMKMIEALGDELRAIAIMGESTTVPLGQEIDLCRHHLRVMSFRRNQSFTLTARGLSLHTPVPPALFHTLIENSLTHNTHADGAEFILSEGVGAGSRRRYELRSPLSGTISSKGTGKGHAYVRARLQHAFRDDWQFSSAPASDREWIDAVEVPNK